MNTILVAITMGLTRNTFAKHDIPKHAYNAMNSRHVQDTTKLRTQMTSRSTWKQLLQCDYQPSRAKHKRTADASDIQEQNAIAGTGKAAKVLCQPKKKKKANRRIQSDEFTWHLQCI